jgi:hypothetical protein
MRFLFTKFFAGLVLGCLMTAGAGLYAQRGELEVQVQFRVIEVGINNLGKKVDPVFKFYLGREDGILLNGNGTCYRFSSKAGTNSFLLSDPKYAGWSNLKIFSIPILTRPSFTITMLCFDNDKGDACEFGRKDDDLSITNKMIDLNDFVPGDYSDTFRIVDTKNQYWSKMEFRYTLVRPQMITADKALKMVNPAAESMRLKSGFPLQNQSKLRFIWEYSDDKGDSWSRLATAKEDPFSLNLNPLSDLFRGKLASTEDILFRFRVVSRDTSVISDTLKVAFTAPPPSFSMQNFSTLKTCPGYENGVVTISNIESVKGKALYILRRGKPGVICDPSQPASLCEGFYRSGEITKGVLELKDLPADSYSLLLYNPDMKVGDVVSNFDFEVQPFPSLKKQQVKFQNPSCVNPLAGEIVMNAIGGSDPDVWQISFSPMTGNQVFNKEMKEAKFRNLPEGTYTLSIIDGCGDEITESVTLRKPVNIEVENIQVRKTPELSIIIAIKNGSGRYKAIISDKNQYVKTIDSLINNIFPIPQKGVYRIQIFDKNDEQCLTIDTTYSVVKAGLPSKKFKNDKAFLDLQNSYFRKSLMIRNKYDLEFV